MSVSFIHANQSPDDVADEALVISALIDSGTFTPWKYGLTENHLSCYYDVWARCIDYQEKTGKAPSLELVRQWDPTFQYISCDIEWAATQLKQRHAADDMKRKMARAMEELRNGRVDEAYTLLQSTERPRGTRKTPVNIFDAYRDAEDAEEWSLEVPYPTLQRVTKGLFKGDLWQIGARTSHGKTWQLINYAVHAAEQGARVRYISLEMPGYRMARRVALVLSHGNKETLAGLNDPTTARRTMYRLRDDLRGSIDIVDPSHARIINVDYLRDLVDGIDMMVVDHVGLLKTSTGSRSVGDWRFAADISNDLKELALGANIPLMSAVQVNRTGATGDVPAKAHQLSGTDANAQDADVIITFTKRSKHVAYHSTEKVREGEQTKFWTELNPAKGLFNEISEDRALDLMTLDNTEV